MSARSRHAPIVLAMTIALMPLLSACGGNNAATAPLIPTTTATIAAALTVTTAATATPSTTNATAVASAQAGSATQAATSTTLPPTESAQGSAGRNVLGKVERDVTYCTVGGVDLKMDLYYPKAGAGGPQRAGATLAAPVVMHVHGGGWTEGEKSNGEVAAEIALLVSQGYFVASIDYRLAPQYQFPAQITDTKCAVRFLRANAAKYTLDPNRFGVIGESAGGHLVALLGTSDQSAGWDVGQYPEQSSRVQAVVDFFGPADLLAPEYQNRGAVGSFTRVFGGGQGAFAKASPVTYITPDDPPFLIMQGDQDTLVPMSQSQELYDRLKAGGVSAQLVIVKNAGHGFVPTGTGVVTPSRQEIARTVVGFFDQQLKKGN